MRRLTYRAGLLLSLALAATGGCSARQAAHAAHETPTPHPLATPAVKAPHWWMVRRGTYTELGSSNYVLDVVAYIVPRPDGHEDAYCFVVARWPDGRAGGGITPALPQVCGR